MPDLGAKVDEDTSEYSESTFQLDGSEQQHRLCLQSHLVKIHMKEHFQNCFGKWQELQEKVFKGRGSILKWIHGIAFLTVIKF